MITPMQLAQPCLYNLNGENPIRHYEARREVLELLQRAREQIQRDLTPHGRDYQTLPDGPARAAKATQEHWEYLAKLEEVEAYIGALTLHAMDAMP